MMLAYIQPQNTGKAWAKLRGYIRKASAEHESMTGLRQRVAEGDVLLAAILDAGDVHGAVLFERLPDSLHVVSLAGEGLPHNWPDVFFREWRLLAAQHGYNVLTLKGRKGWDRKLKRLGFQRHGEFMRWQNGR